MNIKEYQAKELFRQYGLPVLNSHIAKSPEEAFLAAQKLGGRTAAIKAQILAGGRGKGGGIKIVHGPEEARQSAKALLKSRLITPQTSKEGELVSEILVEKGCAIKKEFYLAVLIDPSLSQPVLMASSEGGADIEELSEKSPEKILKIKISLNRGFSFWQAWELGEFLGFSKKEEIQKIFSLGKSLCRLFVEKDASLAEINPLAQTAEGDLIALDGKMSFDESALGRQPDIKLIYEKQEREESEAIALRNGLSFIKLDGEIGCMVNGAGLAMATMDIIKLYGGQPANFLDVGGGAEEEKVKKAFEIILKSKEVKSVLINIFGGIMRCDVIASALIKAAAEMKISVPLVARLEGTRSKEGRERLKRSSLDLIPAENLETAAKKAVQLAKK